MGDIIEANGFVCVDFRRDNQVVHVRLDYHVYYTKHGYHIEFTGKSSTETLELSLKNFVSLL